jgi:hypothetical protein
MLRAGISDSAVEKHMNALMAKLGLDPRRDREPPSGGHPRLPPQWRAGGEPERRNVKPVGAASVDCHCGRVTRRPISLRSRA